MADDDINPLSSILTDKFPMQLKQSERKRTSMTVFSEIKAAIKRLDELTKEFETMRHQEAELVGKFSHDALELIRLRGD